jgi:hypothetical protein
VKRASREWTTRLSRSRRKKQRRLSRFCCARRNPNQPDGKLV